MTFRVSLKSRMALLAVLVSWVAFAAIAVTSNWFVTEDLKRQLGEQQYSVTSLIAEELNEELTNRLDALQTIAAQIDAPMLAHSERLEQLLERTPLLLKLFSGGVFVTNQQGVVVADVAKSGKRKGGHYVDPKTIDIPLNDGASIIGRPMNSTRFHAPALNFASPIKNEKGKSIGVVVGVINLSLSSFFDKVVEGSYGESGGYLVIAPQHNLFVAATNKSRVMQPLPEPGQNPMHDRYMTGYEGYGVAISSKGVEELSAAKGIPVAGWFIVTVVPTEEAFGSVKKMQQTGVFLFSAASLIIGALIWVTMSWFMRRQLVPIAAASKALLTHSTDDMPAKLSALVQKDEVGDLISRFSDLLEELNRRELELRESHELFEAISNSAHDAIVTADSDGNILKWNKGAELTFGYAGNEVIGKSLTMLMPECYRNSHEEGMARVRGGAAPRLMGRVVELNGLRKSGEEFPIELSIAHWVVPRGHFFTGVIRDISERKRFERRLEQHNLELESQVQRRTEELSRALETAKVAERTKDAFLANMSHELRTPLNAVIGMATIANNQASDPRQKDYLEKIVGAGKHLNRVINDLLDLSKIAAGRMDLECVTFSMHKLMEQTRTLMIGRTEEKKLELITTVDANVPIALRGDPVRIEQILLNLIGNALKFTSKGYVRANVKLSGMSGARRHLTIEVEDTGAGIDPGAATKLFQPFSQADETISRRFGGTGLGLTISRQLAKMMGGDITFSSTPGVGTKFKVTLWVEAGEAQNLMTVSASETALKVHRYSDAIVLIVDDQAINREICESMLSELDIQSTCCENGQEALDLLIERGPGAFDAILMDIQMPVMDGLTATKAIRKLPGFENIPIIVLSAYTMAHEVKEALDCGVSDHVAKPVDGDQLYTALAKWISPTKQKDVQNDSDGKVSFVEATPAAPDQVADELLNTQRGLKQFGGVEERYQHWLSEFSSTADARLEEIQQQFEEGNIVEVKKGLHQLKGQVGTLGMVALFNAVANAEQRLGSESAEQEHIFGDLKRVLSDTLAVVATYFHGRGNSRADVGANRNIVWSQKLALGVDFIDRQHQRLFELVGELGELITKPDAEQARNESEIASELFDYARDHFMAEESHMAAQGYPDLERHKLEHAKFFNKATAFNLASASGHASLDDLCDFLRDWLVAHISNSDTRFARYLKR